MFARFRTTLGLAALLTLLTSITVFAKGSFAFITISGPDLKEPIRSSDPALTTDFFAFADFTRSISKVPSDPGIGYEITRYYVDGGRESAFDDLHYYPETGYVFFDGLKGGSSEYDGKWYKAKIEVKSAFENALAAASIVQIQPVEEVAKLQPDTSNVAPSPRPAKIQIQFILAIVAVIGVLGALAFFLRRQRAASE